MYKHFIRYGYTLTHKKFKYLLTTVGLNCIRKSISVNFSLNIFTDTFLKITM